VGGLATCRRGDPPGHPGAAWELNTFNDSVKRAVYLYDVAEVGAPVDAATNGIDTMRGQADDDLMYGQGDNDDMEGDSGDDYMEGNDGADKIAGEDGNDDMTGGTGLINEDVPPPTDPDGTPGRYDEGETDLSGGNGFDTIAGDNAIIRRVLDDDGKWVSNTYNDGIQHERIVLVDINSSSKQLVSGPDVMNGNADDDVMYGQDNRALDNETLGDVMHGDAGDDYMEGNAGADQMYGDAGQDDMVGGTGRVNDDDADGTPGRFDGDDQMDGNAGHDEMAGDNSIIERLLTDLPDGDWQTQTYSHAEDDPTAEHGDRILNPEPVARVRRTVVAVDIVAGVTSGSDLMRGSAGDDDLFGQFDDTGEVGADGGGYPAQTSSDWCGMTVPVADEHVIDPDPRTPVNYDRVPDEWTHALVDGEGLIGGDTLCGNEGEDAILGDQGRILNIVEGTSDVAPYDPDGNRQLHIRPNEPFIDEDIFVAGTLTREVTLQQIPNGGNDLILGGDDGDSLHGGAGVDLINGERGDDRSFGGDGNDAIWGGRGHDHSYGGYGADHLDVRPRTTAVKPVADPHSWFFAAPDDLSTINDGGTADPSDDKEDYDGYSGIDFIYGGYDQDAMQANVGDAGPVLGDRLMDWAGSYNAYYLCPAVFGERVITRDMSPSIIVFWEQMARGDGAQPTTIGEGKSITTDSGFNELAMVYKPDVKKNQKPVHPDTPGHFTCDGPLPIAP
jgi:Ca2+-binding RTX toxin-like protein